MEVKAKCISGLAALALVVSVSGTAMAESQSNLPVQVGNTETVAQSAVPKNVGAEQAVAFTAEVVNVDQASRVVTVKTDDGRSLDIPATADVPNFENVKVGDNANIRIYQSMVIYEGTPGEQPDMDSGEAIVHSTSDGKPSSKLIQALDVSVEVKAINRETREVTLLMPDGNETTAMADPADPVFDQVKVGDNVHVRLIQGISVEIVAAEETK